MLLSKLLYNPDQDNTGDYVQRYDIRPLKLLVRGLAFVFTSFIYKIKLVSKRYPAS